MQFSTEMQPLAWFARRGKGETAFSPGRDEKDIARVPEIGSSADKRDARSRARTMPSDLPRTATLLLKNNTVIKEIVEMNFSSNIFSFTSYIHVKCKAMELKGINQK